MIKNIVFDFGCILTGLDKDRCVRALHQIGAGRIAYYVDECKQEDLFHELETGNYTINQFCDEARRQCAAPVSAAPVSAAPVSSSQSRTASPTAAAPASPAASSPTFGFFGDDLSSLPTNDSLIWAWNELLTGIPVEKLRLIKRLHDDRRYRTFILSNTNVIHWEKSVNEFFRADGLTIDDYFHRIFLSCDMHLVKPDRNIYLSMLAEAGMNPEETLFIDDSPKNCQGAEAVCIRTICDPKGDKWPDLITRTACTIGNFDGVHQGHRHVLSQLRAAADQRGILTTTAITFDRHPRTLFDPSYHPQPICSLEERIHRLHEAGADNTEVLTFDHALASMTAREFMQHILRDRLHASLLLIGYDNRFGKRNPSETFDDYVRYGKELGIEVIAGEPLIQPDGTTISSSLIRNLIAEGKTKEANSYL